jgi:hypothetical protein
MRTVLDVRLSEGDITLDGIPPDPLINAELDIDQVGRYRSVYVSPNITYTAIEADILVSPETY